MANNPITFLGGLAEAMTRLGGRLYQPPPDIVQNVNPRNWPTAGQPIKPVGPEGSEPLGFSYNYSQNLTYTPRFDALYTADELRWLSTYPLARICIENSKDMVCQLNWSIQLRQMPGETKGEVKSRRNKQQSGDSNIRKLTEFFEYPDTEHNWQSWLRPVMDDMLVVDAASLLVRKTLKGNLAELRWIDGATISRFIDDQGFTPAPPSPAYSQLYAAGMGGSGVPRVNLTTDQLIYTPRNIAPRNTISSRLYGYSPTEAIADEIKVGMCRLAFVLAFYERGSLGNMLHIIPKGVPPGKIKEAINFFNSEIAGNLDKRRQYAAIQGFKDGDKDDQIIFPKEPVLADIFDDLHIRKICFGFGTSPQRLQRPQSRASAQTSQSAAEKEGILPWVNWVRGLINFIIHKKFGLSQYEITFDFYDDLDAAKQSKVNQSDVNAGIRPRNEVRDDLGLDRIDIPEMDLPMITTPQGAVPLGHTINPHQPEEDSTFDGNKPAKPAKPAKVELIQRGER